MKRIHIEGLWKTFDMGFKKREGLLPRMFSLISGKETKREVRVLDNISFQAQAGENTFNCKYGKYIQVYL